jgi:hypothetical protein
MYTGFPIGVSYPHFYQGDPALVEAVEGSYPDKAKHESDFYIEPVSSIGFNSFFCSKYNSRYSYMTDTVFCFL